LPKKTRIFNLVVTVTERHYISAGVTYYFCYS